MSDDIKEFKFADGPHEIPGKIYRNIENGEALGFKPGEKLHKDSVSDMKYVEFVEELYKSRSDLYKLYDSFSEVWKPEEKSVAVRGDGFFDLPGQNAVSKMSFDRLKKETGVEVVKKGGKKKRRKRTKRRSRKSKTIRRKSRKKSRIKLSHYLTRF